MHNRYRRFYVEVRVGSYEFDNICREGKGYYFRGYRSSNYAPLVDDLRAIRNTLWLLTDREYKNALHSYLKKKGEKVYKVEKEKVDCFSREKPNTYIHPDRNPFMEIDSERWKSRMAELSGVFRVFDFIFDSKAKFFSSRVKRYYVNSEGSKIFTIKQLYSVYIEAFTRADDGMLLSNDRVFYSDSPNRLPSIEELKKQARQIALELKQLKEAPVLDPYTGPAIFAPRVVGVLFHEAIGHRLEGERQMDEDEGRTFKGQVGKKIIPEFITIVDDPTMNSFNGIPLNGFYIYDDEGIKAEKVMLVERGILRNYLMSRTPIKGFNRSNGHGRSSGEIKPRARMANFIIKSEKSYSYQTLKKMLMEEVKRQGKPFGLIIKNISSGSTQTSSYGYQAFMGSPRLVYKVDATTGEETLVRGVDFVGTPLSSVNKIVATSTEYDVYNGFCGAESGYIPISTIAPYALLKEIELQRKHEKSEKPPILPSPWTSE
jgi:predicted Zn-dependent protease